MVKRIDSLEEAKKIEKRLSDIIIKLLLATREKGLNEEMHEIVNLLQDLRDEI